MLGPVSRESLASLLFHSSAGERLQDFWPLLLEHYLKFVLIKTNDEEFLSHVVYDFENDNALSLDCN